MSIILGVQVPDIPFGELVFNTGGASPIHKLKVVAKLGTIVGAVIVTTKVVLVAHCPELGVKI